MSKGDKNRTRDPRKFGEGWDAINWADKRDPSGISNSVFFKDKLSPSKERKDANAREHLWHLLEKEGKVPKAG